MMYRLVDPTVVPLDPGPHPAAGPYDQRISEALGLTAFEVYRVQLPPGEATVAHDHRADHVEDAYSFTSGSGWVVVDDERVAVAAGQYLAVTGFDVRRQVVAGAEGLVFTAVCAPRHDLPAG